MAVAPLIRTLPAILRLFPQFKSPPMVRGKIIPLQTIDESTDQQLQRQLNYKLKLKRKEDFNDNSHVIKIEEVRKIYEETANAKVAITEVALGIAAALLQDRPTTNLFENFGQDFMDKIRAKALKQSAARRRLTYRYSKREI